MGDLENDNVENCTSGFSKILNDRQLYLKLSIKRYVAKNGFQKKLINKRDKIYGDVKKYSDNTKLETDYKKFSREQFH